MSAVVQQDVLRPAPSGLKGWILDWGLATGLPLFLRLHRALPWNPRLGVVFATRYDEVREVFLNDPCFGVPYAEKLNVIMGGHPFFLSMDDTAQYRRDTAAMRTVVRKDDIPGSLVPEVERMGQDIVGKANGRLEVVDALVRKITFDLYKIYFGIPDPPGADLRVWATRLFEFQFADTQNDPVLRKEVDEIAPKLRRHIQSLIDLRKTQDNPGDDVLGRCIARQRAGTDGFNDDQIRTALMGLMVGGPPQPPMLVPQALEQLLRRPDALAGAQDAATRNDDALLASYVFEAMRFDPLAPFLPRVAIQNPTQRSTIAACTSRAVSVPAGKKVFVAFSSAMMDERRIRDPKMFDPHRMPHEYIHFGYGLHQCFGIHMNKVLLPLMLKALLKQPNLRRAAGRAGKLKKRSAFADTLHVEFG